MRARSETEYPHYYVFSCGVDARTLSLSAVPSRTCKGRPIVVHSPVIDLFIGHFMHQNEVLGRITLRTCQIVEHSTPGSRYTGRLVTYVGTTRSTFRQFKFYQVCSSCRREHVLRCKLIEGNLVIATYTQDRAFSVDEPPAREVSICDLLGESRQPVTRVRCLNGYREPQKYQVGTKLFQFLYHGADQDFLDFYSCTCQRVARLF
ncbi:hypothetical protein BD410DRAFT_796759 [Rickenella mellea]|uniref:Uncharacterized protein n=1 Tax=Rickenella mellea TaxID=50990 RepID=A0A4Y7PHQ9_9AGAM|nr:hypothetical protein BD410DRAFT_796759 [Rickenella mellea]